MDYILFENATGYALFEVNGAEDIGSLVETQQESIADFSKFSKVVKLVSFVPFKTAQHALENINSISEGLLHDDLKDFITTYVPEGKVLGVAEDKLASAINDACNIQCDKSKLVIELQRGIRLHLSHFISDLKEGDLDKAELGLAHSYSRSKVKFNVNRVDNMVIQSICLLDQLDKDINTLSMRVREWYSWHFPELIRVVPDNFEYAKCVKAIGHKESISADEKAAVDKLREALGEDSEDRIAQIVEASKTSMGYEISELDLISILDFASRVVNLTNYKKDLHSYLIKKMNDIAPNLSALLGEIIGARLISKAGSLTSLAKYPASTVQILGAEKALFRALKTRGKTPKYGIIYNSTFIGRAGLKNKGRISRYLANKASIASRIDSFADSPAEVGSKFGEMLRAQVEERLDFYDSGKVPRKNSECMKEVAEEIKKAAEEAETAKKAEKKDKKRKHKKEKKAAEEEEEATAAAVEEKPVVEEKAVAEEVPVEEPPKKKKKHHHKKDKKEDN